MSSKEYIPPKEQTLATTISILENLVTRVPLSEKLLSRPPFRYLLDLTNEIISNTGFGKGLFGEEEFDSGSYSSKHLKVEFLKKLVSLVKLEAPDSETELNPSKVVAGLDPESTNLFLQSFGKLASAKHDTSISVHQILAAAANPFEPTVVPQQRPHSSAVRPASALRRPPSASAAGRTKHVSPAPQQHLDTPPAPVNLEDYEDRSISTGTMRSEPPVFSKIAERVARPGSSFGEKRTNIAAPPVKYQSQPLADITLPDSSNSLAKEQSTLLPTARPDSGAPVDPSVASNTTADEYVVQIPEAAEEQGFLNWLKQVRDEGDGSLDKGASDKKREAFKDEILFLKATQQHFCGVANPIGTTLEYMQADIEAMNSELNFWKKENLKLDKKLNAVVQTVVNRSNPIKEQVEQAEIKIRQEIERILSLRAKIAKNDLKIGKLCQAIVEPSALSLNSENFVNTNLQ